MRVLLTRMIEYGNKILKKLQQWAGVSSKFSADKLLIKLVLEFAHSYYLLVIYSSTLITDYW